MLIPVTARQQVNAASKRMRGGSSSDEFVRSDDDADADADSDDDKRASDSDLSDFNPFHAGSDSDDGGSCVLTYNRRYLI